MQPGHNSKNKLEDELWIIYTNVPIDSPSKNIIKLGTKITTNIVRNIKNALYFSLLVAFCNKIPILDNQHQDLLDWEAPHLATKKYPHTHCR